MWPLYRFRFRISPVTFHFHLLRQIYKYEIINTKPFFQIRSSNSFNFSLRLRRFVLPRLTNWFKLRSIASTYFSIMPRKSRANNVSIFPAWSLFSRTDDFLMTHFFLNVSFSFRVPVKKPLRRTLLKWKSKLMNPVNEKEQIKKILQIRRGQCWTK